MAVAWTTLSESKISSIRLKNRILRSATHEGLANPDGSPTESLIRKYEQLAQGGVGAIITGYAAVNQEGKSPLKNMLMIHREDLIPGYRELVRRIHEKGTPILLQIAHCGRQTRSKITGMRPVAPSPLRDRIYFEERPRELNEVQIGEIIHDFVSAIGRAREAGFDGVQLHIAHGYLLSQFLSPHTNRRRDRWGGSLENRFRIIGEIFEKARSLYPDFPVLAKLNSQDHRRNGMRIQESVAVAKMLEAVGCDAIEVSSGTFEDGFMVTRGPALPVEAMLHHHFAFDRIPISLRKIIRPFVPLLLPGMPQPIRNYNMNDAARIRAAVKIPIIAVGGIRNLEEMENAILEGTTDFVSMSRPFIKEPFLVRKFMEGKTTEASCTSCNYCSILQETESIRCYNGKLRS